MRNLYRKKTILIGGIVVVLIILIAGGCHWYQQQQKTAITLYGNVDIRTLDISFRVAGRLASLNVNEGDRITAGEILGKLDNAPYQIALQQAIANTEIAKANYDLAIAGYRSEEIAQVSAAVTQAQAAYQYTQNFYQRQQSLWKQRTVSANDLENARSARDQAHASLKSLQDKLTQYRSGNRPQQIESAQASLKLAQAQQAKAQLDLHDTTLIAPADGILLTRAIEPGSMINAGGTVLTLSLTQPVWVRAYINEPELGYFQPGHQVLLYTDSRPNKPYHGKVGFVSPSAEFTPKTVETPDLRSNLVYRLRIIVTDADAMLRQGMPVTVTYDFDLNATTSSKATQSE